MSKQIKHLIFIIITILLLISTTFYIISWQQKHRLQGKLIFANSYDAADKVNRIEIINGNNQLNLHKRDGYWCLDAYNGYYADFKLVKSLFDTLNSSAYLVHIANSNSRVKDFVLQNPLETSQNAGTLVNIYSDAALLDAFIIGVKDQEKGYFFARRADSDDIWLVGGNYDLPYHAKAWLPNPFLDVPQSAVEMIAVDGKLLSRQTAGEDFRDRFGLSVNIDWLLHNLSALDIIDIMPESMFLSKFTDLELTKIYDISTFYGLRFEFDFYTTVDEQVWLNIKLSADSVALHAVGDYIKDNNFLFKGWYFKISPMQKDFLMNYKLL